MGNPGVSPEDQNANRKVNSKDCVHEVSDRNEDSIRNWIRGHSFYSLTKSLSTFCLFPDALRLCEMLNFKRDRLIISIVEETSM
jgi:hypothetical protein